MGHLRPLAAYLLALALFLTLAAPTFASDGTYGTVDTGVGLLSAGPDTARMTAVSDAPASVGAAPGRAGGLHPGIAASALSGLGLLGIGGGLTLRRRRF